MEFVCIEAKTFMEMNEALEAVVKKMCETCGSCVSGMDDWIDNQEACMLMDASPGKMLQLRRKQAIPDSYILQGVLQALGYYPFYGKQHSPCNSLKTR